MFLQLLMMASLLEVVRFVLVLALAFAVFSLDARSVLGLVELFHDC